MRFCSFILFVCIVVSNVEALPTGELSKKRAIAHVAASMPYGLFRKAKRNSCAANETNEKADDYNGKDDPENENDADKEEEDNDNKENKDNKGKEEIAYDKEVKDGGEKKY